MIKINLTKWLISSLPPPPLQQDMHILENINYKLNNNQNKYRKMLNLTKSLISTLLLPPHQEMYISENMIFVSFFLTNGFIILTSQVSSKMRLHNIV